jgi:flagellar basal body-associated protein FliL
MTTVINNPGEGENNKSGISSGLGVIIGAVIVVIIMAIVLMFVVPYLRQSATEPQVITPAPVVIPAPITRTFNVEVVRPNIVPVTITSTTTTQ